jgi:quinoprotein glucose dehydrogenase
MIAALSAGAMLSAPNLSAQTTTKPATPAKAVIKPMTTADGEWPSYTGDTKGLRYSPLDQINAENFNKLEVAWRFKTDMLGPRPEFKLEGTPLMAGGVLYATGGTRRAVVALDPTTGELLWMHSENEGARGEASVRPLSGRGLSYWTDGKSARILYVTPGYKLIALDAKTGARIPTFGTNGEVDLKLNNDQTVFPDLITGEMGFQGAPVIGRDVVIIGAAFREGGAPKSFKNNKGYIRGFDVRTGKRKWIFHTIPVKGEPGYETWEKNSADAAGNTGVWTQITVDEELGLVYLPVESPTGDYYGGHRPGNNLYGESIVCLDLNTGARKWFFQMVHHPIWDFDLSAAPILADITVDGKPVKSVAVPSKQGFLYVFDRVTGKPVWPIEERPVEKGDALGEWYSPTQPFPTKPAAYSRNGITNDDILDFTPALKEQGLAIASRYKLGPIFTPPVTSKPGGPLATLANGPTNGGTNWPGGSYDPETHILYAGASNYSPTILGLTPPREGQSDMTMVQGIAPQPAGSPNARGITVQGLPLLKPPYGTITAFDMKKGEILWQIPHGDTPDAIRNHEALKGIDLPRTGQPGTAGTLVTKTLLIAGDLQVTTLPPRARGAVLRAYDKSTGKEVGGILMPAPQSGSPMTYTAGGRQYIVVAVSGGPYSGEYIAYRLPVPAAR